MPDTQTVRALGRGTGVVFSIDDSAPFDVAQRRLREYLSHCRGLYSSGAVSVNVGRRILAPDQLAAIKRILDQETGLTVTGYWCPPEVLSSPPTADHGGPAADEPSAPGGLVEGPHDGEADPPTASASGPPQAERTVRLRSASGGAEGGLVEGCSEPEGRQLFMLFSDLEEASAQSGPSATAETARQQLNGDDLPPMVTNGGPDVISPALASAASAEGGLVEPARPEAVKPAHPELVEGPHACEAYVETAAPLRPKPSPAADALPAAAGGFVEGQNVPSRGSVTNVPGAGFKPGSEALIIKNTCRSGEVIRYPGDVVVFGDVNPGAEIVAAGDIVVLGALRGMAHAGADGNLKATILALNLESHRLQIGSCVGERPRGARKGRGGAKAVVPQIAYLRRRSIFVAPFERRCEDYQGGVPYEG